MLCNIKPVPFHESDKHTFAKIPGGGGGGGGGPDPRSPPLDPPMLSFGKELRLISYSYGTVFIRPQ